MNAQPAILSIAVLASFALAFGGGWLVVRRRGRKRGVLMIVMALVLLVNILLWALPVPASAWDAPPVVFPSDVQAFIARRESCDHWRGEDGYDPERERQIRHAVKLDCHGTDRALAALRTRYAHRDAIVRALAVYEHRIERPIRPTPAR